jgi:hypothetical protein
LGMISTFGSLCDCMASIINKKIDFLNSGSRLNTLLFCILL